MDKKIDKKTKINFLALQVLYYIKLSGYSPNDYLASEFYVNDIYGDEVKLSTAYLRVKRNINYVDDEIVEKINEQPCIHTKLKKDCNIK